MRLADARLSLALPGTRAARAGRAVHATGEPRSGGRRGGRGRCVSTGARAGAGLRFLVPRAAPREQKAAGRRTGTTRPRSASQAALAAARATQASACAVPRTAPAQALRAPPNAAVGTPRAARQQRPEQGQRAWRHAARRRQLRGPGWRGQGALVRPSAQPMLVTCRQRTP